MPDQLEVVKSGKDGAEEVWYFPAKNSAGYLVNAASPLKSPKWKLQIAHVGRVDVEVPVTNPLVQNLLQLPRFHSWTSHARDHETRRGFIVQA